MINVLIVDDSVFFADIMKTALSRYEEIHVAGVASNPYEARDKILTLDPDVLTLDIEMPRMDGIRFLKQLLPQYPIPTIMVSSLESRREEALKAGAAAFLVKPSISDGGGVNFFTKNLVENIIKLGNSAGAPSQGASKSSCMSAKSASAQAPASQGTAAPLPSKKGTDIIALGASTGGTDALEAVVKGLKPDCPPVIITQHMPPVFTGMYSERLNRTTPLAVFEAKDGMRLKNGMCVVAEGGKHMELHKDASGYYISSRAGEKVSGHCPSVDVMFESAAKCSGSATVAALLTGMGADGAKGLLSLKKAGAYTIGQNKDTCVVYGMPMEAYKLGAVCEEAPLERISEIILSKLIR